METCSPVGIPSTLPIDQRSEHALVPVPIYPSLAPATPPTQSPTQYPTHPAADPPTHPPTHPPIHPPTPVTPTAGSTPRSDSFSTGGRGYRGPNPSEMAHYGELLSILRKQGGPSALRGEFLLEKLLQVGGVIGSGTAAAAAA